MHYFSFKKIEKRDFTKILKLRNQKKVRELSFNKKNIPYFK